MLFTPISQAVSTGLMGTTRFRPSPGMGQSARKAGRVVLTSMKRRNNMLQQAVDSQLNRLVWDEAKQQQVFAALEQKEQRKMKRSFPKIAVVLVLMLALTTPAAATAIIRILHSLEGVPVTAVALSDKGAYFIQKGEENQENGLYFQPYGEGAEMELITTLPVYPNVNWRYNALLPMEEEAVKKTVSHLAVDGDTVYGVNFYTGKVATIDRQGLHWLDWSFDSSSLRQGQDGESLEVDSDLLVSNGWLYAKVNCEQKAPTLYNSKQVMGIELATGKTRFFDATFGAVAMCAYKGNLLVCMDNTDLVNYQPDQGLGLGVLDLESGKLTRWNVALPQQTNELSGLTYSETQDIIMFATGRGVYTLEGENGTCQMCANAPFDFLMNAPARLLPDGRYVVYSTMNGLYTFEIAFGAEPGRLTVSVPNECYREFFNLKSSFLGAHPTVLLESMEAEGLSTSAEVANAIQLGQAEPDIFMVEVDSTFGKLLDKGYAEPLMDSEEIVVQASDLWPGLQSAVTDAKGMLRAYPVIYDVKGFYSVNRENWQRFFGEEPVPTTWTGMLDAFLRFLDMEEENEYVFFDYCMHQEMLRQVLTSYAAQAENAGKVPDFIDPVLKEALEKVEQVWEKLKARGFDDMVDEFELHPELESGGAYSLLHTGTFIIGESGVAVDEQTIYPLTFREDDEPVLNTRVWVMMVNPNSKAKKLALELVEMAAEASSTDITRRTMHSADLGPLERQGYEEEVAEYAAKAEECRQELETCDDAGRRAQLEDTLAIYEWRATDESFRWHVTPYAAEALRTIGPRLNAFERSLCTANASWQTRCQQLSKRVMDGQLTCDQLLDELQHVAQMMMMEEE